MRCPRCGAERIGERSERTARGYRRFRCRACGKQFNGHRQVAAGGLAGAGQGG